MSEQKKAENSANNGKLSRREFITKASALGLAIAVAPSGLISNAFAASPKTGGALRIACTGGSTSDTLDPGTFSASWHTVVNYGLRNGLVEIDHEFKPVPELAESWEASPDAKTWIFNLRKGVEFHNGKPFKSEDVIYTMNHHRKDDSKSNAKAILKSVKDIEKDGDYRVIFRLNSGNADLPSILADYHLTIFPFGSTYDDLQKGIGTGGYILKSWQPGVEAVATRNPNYWKKGRAHFDMVKVLSIPDVNTRTNALQTGQVDHIDRCERKTFGLLERSKGIKTLQVNSLTHYSMPMLTDTTPFNDNNVRLALKYAVNRQQLLDLILQGYGYIGNDQPIAKIQRYYNPDLPQRPYDPEKAKWHMKQAGMTDQTFLLHAADAAFVGAVDSAVLIAESAAKAGIKIKVVREPNDGYWNEVWLKKSWCTSYWGGRPTENQMFTDGYSAGATWNDTRWKNERFNQLLDSVRAELDDSRRREMYYEMQQLVHEDGGALIPFFADLLEASSDKLDHGPVAGDFGLDGVRILERWWFA